MHRRLQRTSSIVLLVAAALALGACDRGAGETDTETATAGTENSWALEKQFPGPDHPVSLVLRLDRTELGLADRLVFEQELQITNGFEAEFPEYLPEDFEGFAVVDIQRPTSDAAASPGGGNDRTIIIKRLVLEPDRSGELAIAPLAIYFHRSGEAEESHFLTDEITVTVESVEDIGALSVKPMQDIFETAPEEPKSRWILWTALAAALILVAGGVVVGLTTRRRAPPPPRPAHDIAYESLRNLLALGLVEKGEIELFFVHLSAILRRYIENRFRVHAPERTSEEFLEEAARHPALEAHRERLGEFLSLSDQVKFARFEPSEADIQSAFDVSKQFVEETRANAETRANVQGQGLATAGDAR